MRRIIAVLALCGICVAPSFARDYTYLDLLRQLTDLDRLTHVQEGVTAGAATSYDRSETSAWGSNGDSGHYQRVERNGEAVLLDIDGPGVIQRIWSANPQGTLRFYFDGAQTPQWEVPFADLFTGDLPPFYRPLVFSRGKGNNANDCYVPIPFAKHIKVCADQAYNQYYQLNYLIYPANTGLPNFTMPASAEVKAFALEQAKVWKHPDRDPKPQLLRQTTVKQQVTVQPGKSATLAELAGSGVIRAIRLSNNAMQRYWPRKLVLKGTWDNAPEPQLWAPIGSLLGSTGKRQYASLIAGCHEGKTWLHWPMPFGQMAKLEVVNYLEQPVKMDVEVDWAPQTFAADACYFYARWRHEFECQTFDYPIIETAGQGHLVGVSLQVDHPTSGWFGEGDEKVWVDDAQWPTWIGTGTEDYFGDAWGLHSFSEPAFGCNEPGGLVVSSSLGAHKGDRTSAFRWHFMDPIPFTQRLRFTMEDYPPYAKDYASTAIWYQREAKPDFASLADKTYTGADRPNVPPSEQNYSGGVFAHITPSDVRTYGLDVPYTLEAEDLYSGQRGKLVNDARRPYEFNHERAIDCGLVNPNDQLLTFRWTSPAESMYYPVIYTSPDTRARLGMLVDGKTLPQISEKRGVGQQMGGMVFTAGEHQITIVAMKEGRALIDAITFLPAESASDVLEAETLSVSVPEGVKAEPIAGPDFSAGRSLRLDATQANQGFIFQLPEAKSYLLGVRAMMGPDCGLIQAFSNGKPLGAAFDLYSKKPKLSARIYPLGYLTQPSIELRVIGKNDASTGYHAEIDYFTWQPMILHPDSEVDLWAEVTRCRRCEYRIQDMGPEWLDSHQLWVQPSDKGATIEIALHVPTSGVYDLTARYTQSFDYAIVQAQLDGRLLGNRIDLYAPAVTHGPEVPLGRVMLTPGQHILKLTAVDKNKASRGYLFGLDYLVVHKAK